MCSKEREKARKKKETDNYFCLGKAIEKTDKPLS